MTLLNVEELFNTPMTATLITEEILYQMWKVLDDNGQKNDYDKRFEEIGTVLVVLDGYSTIAPSVEELFTVFETVTGEDVGIMTKIRYKH